MATTEWITLRDCCSHYDIEITFVESLQEYGLLELSSVQEVTYIHEDTIPRLEKFIRLHYELNINLEGLDVIANLIEKIESLQREVSLLKNNVYGTSQASESFSI